MSACVIAPALLLVLAVSALGWEKPPALPAGHRAEYYLLKDDGSYRFGYDTGEGQSADVSADQSNQVQGQYSYTDRAGKRVNVAYTAGDSGFIPRLEGRLTESSQEGFLGPGHGKAFTTVKTPVASGEFAAGYSQGDESYDASADASYSFSIDTDSYKRTETSDAKGNIRGQYSYSSQGGGGGHSLSYIAGEGTGFVVTSSDTTEEFGAGSGSDSSKTLSPYYTGPTADTRSNLNNDGTYSFSFSTDDQSRQESIDSHNNVRGSYSFKAKDDGQTRRVDYAAGSATGFIATGSHLPVSSEQSGRATSLEYSSSGQSSPTSFDHTISSSKGSRPSSYTSLSDTGTPKGGVDSDGSYSFAYSAGDSSRQESADSKNNVRGSFTFKTQDDGKARRVDYEAGAATGFVAKGSHLPSVLNPMSSASAGGYSGVLSLQSPSRDYTDTSSDSRGEAVSTGDASYSFSYSSGDQSRQESSDAQGNINGQYSFTGTDGVQRKVDYSAGAERGFRAKVASAVGLTSGTSTSFGSFSQTPETSHTSEAGISSTGIQSDGSYSFAYNTADHSHQDSSDAPNNAQGTYSFGAKDGGQNRRINYQAGAATGFMVKGTHLPAAVSPYGTESGYFSFPSQSSVTSDSASVDASASSSGAQSDGSYSFSYKTADQSRQESADTKNNVRGSYTFKERDDGKTYRVDYKAGATTGFIAKGAHIPEGPTVPSSGLGAVGTVLSHGKHSASSPHIGSVNSETSKSSVGSYSSHNTGDHSVGESSGSQGNNISHDGRSSGDASYSYSYQTDSSSKQERSDAQGNVEGTFSFLGGDGVNRRVHYTSRGNEGFVVSGDHLPKSVNDGTTRATAGFGALSFVPTTVTPPHIKSQEVDAANFLLKKFLPPESPKTFGYVFDTKV